MNVFLSTHPNVAPGARGRTGVPRPSAPVIKTVFLNKQFFSQQLWFFLKIQIQKLLTPTKLECSLFRSKKDFRDKKGDLMKKRRKKRKLTAPSKGN
jgi:hypothetical protein